MSGSAYSRIPPDRPATEEEALGLYRPVVDYFVARARASLLRDYDDIRQDAFLGVVQAWRTWDPAKANGSTFKSWTVFMVRQWVFYKGLVFFGFDVRRAHSGGYYRERMAVMDPQVRLDEVRDGWDEGPYRYLADPGAEVAYDFSGPTFGQLVGLVKSERDRICLREYYLKGRTLEDIGGELGITREYVRQRLQKSYVEIKKALERRRKLAAKAGRESAPVRSAFSVKPRSPMTRPRPLPMTMAVPLSGLAKIAQVSRRTVYRWIESNGKEAVVELCNRIIQEFGGAVIRPEALARSIGVSRSTIYRLVAEGKIKVLNFFGTTIRIPVSEVRRLWDEAVARGVVEPRALTDRELERLFANTARDA